MMDFNWLQGLLGQYTHGTSPINLTLPDSLFNGPVSQFPNAPNMTAAEITQLPAYMEPGAINNSSPAPNFNPDWSTSADMDLLAPDALKKLSEALGTAQGMLPLDVTKTPQYAPMGGISKGSPIQAYLWRSLLKPQA